MTRFPYPLTVVTSVTHYRWNGAVHAYTAYVREMDQWAQLFRELVVVAPCQDAPPPEDCAPFARGNVRVWPQREVGGTTLAAKLGLAIQLPRLALDLARVLWRADAVHVRCPGNLGGLAALLAPLCSRRVTAKYAMQWSHYPGEPLSYRAQRALLGSRWFRGPVTVYGAWPRQRPHVVPFFTSVLTVTQLERAHAAIAARRAAAGPAGGPAGALRVLYVGRLTAFKHVDAALHAVARVRAQGIAATLTVVGEGPARAGLESLAGTLGVAGAVRFTGALPFDRVLDAYEDADALVLVSEAEGWPKAIAEGMAFGLVCIGADRGFVPQMLAEGRGVVVAAGDADALAGVLARLAADPAGRTAMGARAADWAHQRSLEGLRDAIGDLLAERWPPADAPPGSPPGRPHPRPAHGPAA